MKIINHMAKLRDDRGITQQALSDRTGLHVQYISDLERGKRDISKISFGNALKIADGLGIADPRNLYSVEE